MLKFHASAAFAASGENARIPLGFDVPRRGSSVLVHPHADPFGVKKMRPFSEKL